MINHKPKEIREQGAAGVTVEYLRYWSNGHHQFWACVVEAAAFIFDAFEAVVLLTALAAVSFKTLCDTELWMLLCWWPVSSSAAAVFDALSETLGGRLSISLYSAVVFSKTLPKWVSVWVSFIILVCTTQEWFSHSLSTKWAVTKWSPSLVRATLFGLGGDENLVNTVFPNPGLQGSLLCVF